MTVETTEPPEQIEALAQDLEAASRRLSEQAQEHTRAARELAALARPALLHHPKQLARRLRAAERKLPAALRERLDLTSLWARLERYERQAPTLLRRSLGTALKEACAQAGLEFRVVSREEPVEVRIPPLAVTLDFGTGQASLGFARSTLATCELSAERILAAHAAVVRDLERAFDPDTFFDTCRHAYRLALADDGGREGDRVELVQVLPFMALLQQSTGFQRNPTREGFRSYGRAHLAYDVLRLRRQGALTRDGVRLNLGVATGISASQRGRAIYFEDEHGHGEFKLTLYFTRATEGEAR
jgi:hypothetical protein